MNTSALKILTVLLGLLLLLQFSFAKKYLCYTGDRQYPTLVDRFYIEESPEVNCQDNLSMNRAIVAIYEVEDVYAKNEVYNRTEVYSVAESDQRNGETYNKAAALVEDMRNHIQEEVTASINGLPESLFTEAAKNKLRTELLPELQNMIDREVANQVSLAKAELIETLADDEAFIEAIVQNIESSD